MLGRDGNIHIRLIGSTPLDDVGSYKRHSIFNLLEHAMSSNFVNGY